MHLFFDTETTGLPLFKDPSDHPEQPDLVQLAAVVMDEDMKERASMSVIIHTGRKSDEKALLAHGIDLDVTEKYGIPLVDALDQFRNLAQMAKVGICHNYDFDSRLMRIAYKKIGRKEGADGILPPEKYCTMKTATPICKLPPVGPRRGGYKWPKLEECYGMWFGKSLEGAHDAMVDVRATIEVYKYLQNVSNPDRMPSRRSGPPTARKPQKANVSQASLLPL